MTQTYFILVNQFIDLVIILTLILKNVTHWLNANKISLNVKKTEFAIFKQQRKKLDSPIKINLNCKRFYPSKSVIYLSIKIKLNLAIN